MDEADASRTDHVDESDASAFDLARAGLDSEDALDQRSGLEVARCHAAAPPVIAALAGGSTPAAIRALLAVRTGLRPG